MTDDQFKAIEKRLMERYGKCKHDIVVGNLTLTQEISAYARGISDAYQLICEVTNAYPKDKEQSGNAQSL